MRDNIPTAGRQGYDGGAPFPMPARAGWIPQPRRAILGDAAVKRFFVATFVSLVAIVHAVPQESGVISQEPQAAPPVIDAYGQGEQMLALGASLMLPLFTYLPAAPVDGNSLTGTNLSPGGKLSLRWNAFLNSRLTIGAEVGGMFAIDRHGEPLLMVPVTGRLSYLFNADLFGLGRFDIPIFVNAGIGFMKLADLFNVNLTLRPGVAIRYRYDRNWSFGGSVSAWLMFEPMWGTPAAGSGAGLTTFLDISPEIVYHF